MVTFNESFQLFAGADYPTRVLLARIYLIAIDVTIECVSVEFYVAILGVILTIFHLTSLTRQSMRTSSIMSIMIGIAISDLISMIIAIGTEDIVLRFEVQECTPPLTLFVNQVYAVIQAIRDDVIRISTWLSVTMTLIRYLVLKLASRPSRIQKIQSFSFGFHVFWMTTVISSLFSVVFYFREDIVIVSVWKPADKCPSYPTLPVYDTVPSALFTFHNGIVHRAFMLINGLLSKILPCLLLPILTGLLTLELRTKRALLSTTTSAQQSTERTTGLVIFMTITYFFALLPAGITLVFQAVYTDIGVLDLSFKLVNLEFYLAFFGVISTIFHLIILAQKSMRTSSIISIMIGIAISDLISMIVAIGERDIVLNFEIQDCSPPLTLLSNYIFGIIQTIRDDVIRISTWLSVTMALIRYLVLKLASRPSALVSRYSFGFRVFWVSGVISSLFSIAYYLRAQLVLVGEWTPAEYCTESFPSPLPIYDAHPSDLFSALNGLLLRIFMSLNGSLSKILPCLLFPILTGLLILELRKARRRRTSSKMKAMERTTGLVIFITVTFFMALLPAGMITSLQVVYTDVGFLYLNTYVDIICAALLTLNACLHCFICSAMSTQYRKTSQTTKVCSSQHFSSKEQ